MGVRRWAAWLAGLRVLVMGAVLVAALGGGIVSPVSAQEPEPAVTTVPQPEPLDRTAGLDNSDLFDLREPREPERVPRAALVLLAGGMVVVMLFGGMMYGSRFQRPHTKGMTTRR